MSVLLQERRSALIFTVVTGQIDVRAPNSDTLFKVIKALGFQLTLAPVPPATPAQ